MSDTQELPQAETNEDPVAEPESKEEAEVRTPQPPVQISPSVWISLFYVFAGLCLLVALIALMSGASFYDVLLRSLIGLVAFVLIEILFISTVVMPLQAKQHARYVVEKRLAAVEEKKRQQEAIQQSFGRRSRPSRRATQPVQTETAEDPIVDSSAVAADTESPELDSEMPDVEDQAAGLRRLVTAST